MGVGRHTGRATSLCWFAALFLWSELPAPSSWAAPLHCLPAFHAVEVPADSLILQNIFHIVGVPGVKRNARVDLYLGPQSLQVRRRDKQRLILPYARVRRVEMLDGTRTYAKAAYAAVLGFGVAGALLLRKKRHVDTLVIDFLNERGGEMGLILQVPLGQGAPCLDWFKRRGIVVAEPPAAETSETSSGKGEPKP